MTKKMLQNEQIIQRRFCREHVNANKIYKLKKEEYNAAENMIKSCSSTQSHEPLKLSIWALEWNNKLSL